jgi:hypothetical protein
MPHQWNNFSLIFFTHSGVARTAVGGNPKRIQYAVMRYIFENAKTALEGLLML